MPIIALVSALAQFAPTIAGWLGGPKAEDVATKVVGIAQAVTGAPSGDAALAAIQSDPAMAEKFQEAVLQNHLELEQLALQGRQMDYDFDEKMVTSEVADRTNARQMQMSTHSPMPAILTVFITLGFFGMLIAMMVQTVPSGNQAIMNVMLGSLGTAWVSAVSFWLGSSYGSLRKTDQMAAVAGVQTPTASLAASVIRDEQQ
jgi:hypothetical protein